MTQPNSIAEAFEPLLPDVAPEEIPMIIAILERIAATKYHGWASETDDPVEREGLLACAGREEEISTFIESLEDDASRRSAELNARFPDLKERYDSILSGRSRIEQLRIQAEGELAGADYMRQFAEVSAGPVAARYISLALCEEVNSKYLFALIEAL